MVDRREVLAQIAATAAVSGLVVSSSLALQARRASGRDIGPAPAPRPRASTANLRERIGLFDVMSPGQAREVRDGVSRDDTAAFAEALAAAAIVEGPAGSYRVSGLQVPGGRTIQGVGGKPVLRAVRGRGSPILQGVRSADIAIRNLMFDGENALTASASFTDVHRVALSAIGVTRVPGYGLIFDGCIDSQLAGAEFLDTGAPQGHAAAAFVDWTRPGHRNRVSDIKGERVIGRLVSFLSQADSVVENVDRRNGARGETVYFLNCLRSRMDRITHIGGGAGRPSRSSPGGDGCAIDGGSVECVASNGLSANSSGHGFSINGTKDHEGASYNIVRNWTSRDCDEGGVVISDQGILGSSPSHNRISNCLVENPGVRVPEAAFACFGGYDNQFIDCRARDTRAVKRMTVGFEEGTGANGADRNTWRGSVGKGEFVRAGIVRIGRHSIATLTP